MVMNYMSVERCVFLVCPAAKQISAFLPESCFTRFMCTGNSAKYGVAKLSLSGHCHKCASLVTGLQNIAWYYFESPCRNAISDYYYI